MAAFEEFFPEHKDNAEKLLHNSFNNRKKKLELYKNTEPKITKQAHPEKHPGSKVFNLFHRSSAKAENDELEVYLKGGEVFEMDPNDTKSALIWWKVRHTE